jgi:hypothetical protein
MQFSDRDYYEHLWGNYDILAVLGTLAQTDEYFDCDVRDHNGRTLLFWALFPNFGGFDLALDYSIPDRLATAELLIAKGVDPSAGIPEENPIKYAIQDGLPKNIAIVEFLSPLVFQRETNNTMDSSKERGVHVEDLWMSFFHQVARYCSKETIELWIRHGANPRYLPLQ